VYLHERKMKYYNAQMMRVAEQLFDESPDLPMISVIRALKRARTTPVTGSKGRPPPAAVLAAARQELRGTGTV
jgi:hypothetical protein